MTTVLVTFYVRPFSALKRELWSEKERDAEVYEVRGRKKGLESLRSVSEIVTFT